MEIEWRAIETDRHYAVSNIGQVKNVKRGALLKPQSNNGYRYVSLPINGKWKYKAVHQLVAIAFIPNLENKAEVNHKNGIKSDNRHSNLEWATRKENVKHASANGLWTKEMSIPPFKDKFGKDHNRSVKLLCSNGIIYYGYAEAGRKLGINWDTIQSAVKRKRPLRNGLLFSIIDHEIY